MAPEQEKEKSDPPGRLGRLRFAKPFGRSAAQASSGNDGQPDMEGGRSRPPKWSMGVLNDPETVEVPGSVLLLAAHRNEPLGLRNVHARTSHSSIPAGFAVDEHHSHSRSHSVSHPHGETQPHAALSPNAEGHSTSNSAPSSAPTSSVPASSAPLAPGRGGTEPPLPAGGSPDDGDEKKMTDDGQIILEPQPEDSANDPLNWPSWRRDLALGSLGIYCMIGGGITPLIAAGFTDVGETYNIDPHDVALTTGLYMMGLGVGSVIFSPTAILYGKRPVYLFSVIMFIATSLWAGFSPTYNSLLAARVFQGIAVSPVECLPSATIAEIFFLHERAYRIGIYTLLLLGGKNLVPLVSAAIIGSLGWRWTFFITAMIVAFCGVLLFFFVPETFWDRTPTRKPSKRPSFLRRISSHYTGGAHTPRTPRTPKTPRVPAQSTTEPEHPMSRGAASGGKGLHVGFKTDAEEAHAHSHAQGVEAEKSGLAGPNAENAGLGAVTGADNPATGADPISPRNPARFSSDIPQEAGHAPPSLDVAGGPTSPVSSHRESLSQGGGYFAGHALDKEGITKDSLRSPPKVKAYTHNLRQQPPKTFTQQLKPFHGRLNNDKWIKVMVRPFILFAYPAVLWSAAVYACSIGWLIVISETLAIIYRDPEVYNFDALQTGLVYISPFIGGILGTGVAGKISDIVVRAMSKRNGGMYEPEFRLAMAFPILITTCIGLMGFGWSAEQKNHWIVPTVFFGVVSFGCSLGSTTSITFCVDSYRQYAGEALVTLNFAKNVFHGLVFSFFVAHWMEDDGPKMVYIWIGIIQLILMLFTIPMYIYGKRARMWTARRNLMEKF